MKKIFFTFYCKKVDEEREREKKPECAKCDRNNFFAFKILIGINGAIFVH